MARDCFRGIEVQRSRPVIAPRQRWNREYGGKVVERNRIGHFFNPEREGFEPPVPFRVQWFSRPPPSTTRPSLPPSLARIASRASARRVRAPRRDGGRTAILFGNRCTRRDARAGKHGGVGIERRADVIERRR